MTNKGRAVLGINYTVRRKRKPGICVTKEKNALRKTIFKEKDDGWENMSILIDTNPTATNPKVNKRKKQSFKFSEFEFST